MKLYRASGRCESQTDDEDHNLAILEQNSSCIIMTCESNNVVTVKDLFSVHILKDLPIHILVS